MLSFVLQKIRSKKWMVISLLLGNLLMVAIASAAPMYSQASAQRTLTRNLSDRMVETGEHPGAISASNSFAYSRFVNPSAGHGFFCKGSVKAF